MKQFFIFCILLISAMSYSQAEKGTYQLGGSGSFHIEGNDYSIFYVNPNTGYFVCNKLCLGISVPLELVDMDKFYYGFNPFAKFFFKSSSSHSFFVIGELGTLSLIAADNNLSYGTLAVGIGHAWFLNKSISFEAELISGTNFENISLGLFLGFHAYLKKESTSITKN